LFKKIFFKLLQQTNHTQISTKKEKKKDSLNQYKEREKKIA